ncbi:MAG: putative oxidoreductase [Alphaproteobacteria bacterium MarineAlpha9_Bin4]|nr:3-hydroxyacyl-CoA dehydrogenase [Pelagibacterales bacterium]PPR27166.1 MAG: putative oxidoreductase [Alphaproteobacteria bacterium MarineAlpha9_Bin4]|tara:strand:+ start:989 stop:1756 length:768 start_codon:yes stop_codon:yes gene_type:complete
MKIEDINAVITGGSSGLGKATVEIILDNGGKVTILDTQKTKGEEIAASKGKNCSFLYTDVTEEKSIKENLSIIKESFGDINLAVNCAGVGTPEKVIGKEKTHSTINFEKILKVNLTGTFNVIKNVADLMQNNSSSDDGFKGLIINTASIAAYDGQIGQAAYSASKGGIVSMTLPIARELARFGIRICTIAPGLFETPMLQGLPEKAYNSLVDSTIFPKRLGFPNEYAKLVLAIYKNNMLNGETIRLDGSLRLAPK